jgi:hypothetical protein
MNRPPKKRSAKSLRVIPILVPRPFWRATAYRLLGRGTTWKRIRQAILEDCGNACGICGSSGGRLTCHEQWKYSDEDGIAELVGFTATCDPCDAVMHIGRTSQYGGLDAALAHLAKLNDITLNAARAVIDEAMNQWRKRNGREWRIAVGPKLLGRFPSLAVLTDPKSEPRAQGQGSKGEGHVRDQRDG